MDMKIRLCKWMAVFFAILMLLGMAVSAFADEAEYNQIPDEVSSENSDNGTAVPSDEAEDAISVASGEEYESNSISMLSAAAPATASLTLDNNSGWFRVDVSNASGASRVRVAVWSDKNWQDDLVWYDASSSGNGNYVATYNISRHSYEQGKYYFDVYTYDGNGTGTCIASITGEFTTKAESVKASINNASGWFRVDISGVEGAVSKVLVPVWHRADQKDLVWYEAVSNGNGSYVISKNIAPQNYQSGLYYFDVYAVSPGGTKTYIGGDSASFTVSASEVSLSEISKNMSYKLTVSDVVIPGGVKSVKIAVWSAKDGQDDLVWYDASKSGNTYSINVDISKHKTEGKYYADAYAISATGSKVYIGGNYNINVANSASARISVTEYDENKGTFDVNVIVSSSSPAISKVVVPVWCAADQSDLYWYQAQKQSDGTWKATVNAENHNGSQGTYKVDTYATYENGVYKYLCGVSLKFNPVNTLSIKQTSGGHRLATISGYKNASNVQFAVWSDIKGQDDLIWYTASKTSNGTWQADINLQNHKHTGTFNVHVYVDGKGVKTSTFTATDSEFATGYSKVQSYVKQILNVTGRDLYAAYKWVVNNISYKSYSIPMPTPEGYSRQQYYFTTLFETRQGNCFCYAAAVYWIAKELGYDATLMERRVHNTSGIGPHGWVEVVINGTTYVLDPQAESQLHTNFYMITYASNALRYRTDLYPY